FDTPSAVFDSAKQAMVRGDYAAFCGCFTDDGLSLLAGSLRLTSGFLQLAGQQKEADAQSLKRAKDIEKINRQYLKPGAAEGGNINLSAPEGEMGAAVAKLADSIPDRAAYTSALFAALQANSDFPDRPAPFADAQLVDLKSSGTTAMGVLDGTFLGPGKSKTP